MRIPTHAQALVEGEVVDVDLLWSRVTKVLESMIISRSELSVRGQLRRLERVIGEDDIEFVSRVHMICKLVEHAKE